MRAPVRLRHRYTNIYIYIHNFVHIHTNRSSFQGISNCWGELNPQTNRGCVTRQTCLLCDTAEMSAVGHGRQAPKAGRPARLNQRAIQPHNVQLCHERKGQAFTSFSTYLGMRKCYMMDGYMHIYAYQSFLCSGRLGLMVRTGFREPIARYRCREPACDVFRFWAGGIGCRRVDADTYMYIYICEGRHQLVGTIRTGVKNK